MRELEELKKVIAEGATIIAEIEQNKEAIQALGAYVTASLDGTASFVQGNIETILSTITTSIINTWEKSLLSRCEAWSKARLILIDKGGFTPEEAYDILFSRKEELKDSVNSIIDALKEGQSAKTNKENKEESTKSRPSSKIGGLEIGSKN